MISIHARQGILQGLRWATASALMCATPALHAQVATNIPPAVAGAPHLTAERITVHGRALEGNLEGDSPDRAVLVVLPPGYAKHPKQHYPVLYALHGYSIGAEQWTSEIHALDTIANAYGTGVPEMIVVFPDSKTVHNGSMYSSSVTTGDFETFIARDLVAYVDAHYRSIPDRASRGLAGHSMGGYGTSRIGMKHPDVFGALYMMSPCCLSARTADQFDPAMAAQLAGVTVLADSAKLPFFARAQLASAAAWSPNPTKPPLFLDLPVKDGVVQPDVLARWAANAPLAFVDQYVGNLRQYRAIALDVGDQDSLKDDTRKLHEALDRYGIANSFEIYPGTHVSNVAYRFEDYVLPFFGKQLKH
ncbi:alpha/beta hydrolase [Glacieibacterium megasporae]|uniref:alpha/beta hydrolase n=1 Tax=Glacieibacterium megasporae TaxID=2835787 RepID=UPI001C1DF274|nr:alpha/beta hydrolase-fold protein [Polymorphobacter megasporae]UAJ09067.1 alpha/beta fold hydrolase [Polymorphobacter megasporae]